MSSQVNKDITTIALSKGRIFDECRELLEKIGITVEQKEIDGRKLVLSTNKPDVRLLIIRATDVPTYVQYGAAEDTLMEFAGDGIYEPLDLGIAKCKLMVAGVEGKTVSSKRMRVATKYLQSTRRYFASKGQQVELIKLYGSMELAPMKIKSATLKPLIEEFRVAVEKP